MTNRAAAIRYARALLEVSRASADPVQVERELSNFAGLLTTHPMLGNALTNPAIPSARKHAVVTALVPRLGGVSSVTERLLGMLAERDRFSILDEILESFRERLGQLQGVVRARITTASPLSAARTSELAQSIEQATGKRIELTTAVDDTLLGGMVAQIGGTVYDGSIANHLGRLRRRFLSEA